MRTAVIAKIRQAPMLVRRAVADVGVETVLTLAFVAKLAAGTSLAHGVATIVGDEVGGGGSVVMFPGEARAEAATVRAAVRRAEVVEVRAGARAARSAARARAAVVDSMVRVTVVGPGGVVESRLVMVRRR